jgi:hypothetical protein
MTEDLAPFFADFAVDATVNGQAVRGIFDNGFALGSVGIGMAGTQPTLRLRTADVTADPVGQAVSVNAVAYTVAAHEPDGTGVSVLMLERA